MILASAQTKPIRFDINANLEEHYKFIEFASDNGAGLIIFPEMSITGYERYEALSMAFTENDSRLSKLKQLSVERSIVIVVGAPVVIEDELYIGSFIIKPDNSVSIYTKQYLHSGEELFFKSSFDYNPVIKLENEKISLAICADIVNPKHAENSHKRNSTIYLASIFYTPNGVPEAYETLSGYAKKYSMNILMSNFSGCSWDMESGGKSGFWNDKGRFIAGLSDKDAGLLLIEKSSGNWIEKKVLQDI